MVITTVAIVVIVVVTTAEAITIAIVTIAVIVIVIVLDGVQHRDVGFALDGSEEVFGKGSRRSGIEAGIVDEHVCAASGSSAATIAAAVPGRVGMTRQLGPRVELVWRDEPIPRMSVSLRPEARLQGLTRFLRKTNNRRGREHRNRQDDPEHRTTCHYLDLRTRV